MSRQTAAATTTATSTAPTTGPQHTAESDFLSRHRKFYQLLDAYRFDVDKLPRPTAVTDIAQDEALRRLAHLNELLTDHTNITAVFDQQIYDGGYIHRLRQFLDSSHFTDHERGAYLNREQFKAIMVLYPLARSTYPVPSLNSPTLDAIAADFQRIYNLKPQELKAFFLNPDSGYGPEDIIAAHRMLCIDAPQLATISRKSRDKQPLTVDEFYARKRLATMQADGFPLSRIRSSLSHNARNALITLRQCLALYQNSDVRFNLNSITQITKKDLAQLLDNYGCTKIHHVRALRQLLTKTPITYQQAQILRPLLTTANTTLSKKEKGVVKRLLANHQGSANPAGIATLQVKINDSRTAITPVQRQAIGLLLMPERELLPYGMEVQSAFWNELGIDESNIDPLRNPEFYTKVSHLITQAQQRFLTRLLTWIGQQEAGELQVNVSAVIQGRSDRISHADALLQSDWAKQGEGLDAYFNSLRPTPSTAEQQRSSSGSSSTQKPTATAAKKPTSSAKKSAGAQQDQSAAAKAPSIPEFISPEHDTQYQASIRILRCLENIQVTLAQGGSASAAAIRQLSLMDKLEQFGLSRARLKYLLLRQNGANNFVGLLKQLSDPLIKDRIVHFYNSKHWAVLLSRQPELRMAILQLDWVLFEPENLFEFDEMHTIRIEAQAVLFQQHTISNLTMMDTGRLTQQWGEPQYHTPQEFLDDTTWEDGHTAPADFNEIPDVVKYDLFSEGYMEHLVREHDIDLEDLASEDLPRGWDCDEMEAAQQVLSPLFDDSPLKTPAEILAESAQKQAESVTHSRISQFIDCSTWIDNVLSDKFPGYRKLNERLAQDKRRMGVEAGTVAKTGDQADIDLTSPGKSRASGKPTKKKKMKQRSTFLLFAGENPNQKTNTPADQHTKAKAGPKTPRHP